MLKQYLSSKFNSLNLLLSHSIVIRYQPKRSIFDKTSYNPDWVPRLKPYSKHRKPQISAWNDSEVVGPHVIPPLRNIRHPSRYLKLIQMQQKKKAQCSKQYLLDDIRSGDLIDITYQQTYENDQTVTYRCFVLSFKRRNSLTASLQVLIRLGGMNIKAIYLVHSPKVKNIKLISRGSGDLRANLKSKWMTMSKTQVQKPLIRNRVVKLRKGQKRRAKVTRRGAIQFDSIESDNIKTILK